MRTRGIMGRRRQREVSRSGALSALLALAVFALSACLHAASASTLALRFDPAYAPPDRASTAAQVASLLSLGDSGSVRTAAQLQDALDAFNVPEGAFMQRDIRVAVHWTNGSLAAVDPSTGLPFEIAVASVSSNASVPDTYAGQLCVVEGVESTVDVPLPAPRVTCPQDGLVRARVSPSAGYATFRHLTHTRHTMVGFGGAFDTRDLQFTVPSDPSVAPLRSAAVRVTRTVAKLRVVSASLSNVTANNPLAPIVVEVLTSDGAGGFVRLTDGLDAAAAVDLTIPRTINGTALKSFDADGRLIANASLVELGGANVFVAHNGEAVMRARAQAGVAVFAGVQILDALDGLCLNFTASRPYRPFTRLPTEYNATVDPEAVLLTPFFNAKAQVAVEMRVVAGTNTDASRPLRSHFQFDVLPRIQIYDAAGYVVTSGRDSSMTVTASAGGLCLTEQTFRPTRGVFDFTGSVCSVATAVNLTFSATNSLGQTVSFTLRPFDVVPDIDIAVITPVSGLWYWIGGTLETIIRIFFDDLRAGLYPSLVPGRAAHVNVEFGDAASAQITALDVGLDMIDRLKPAVMLGPMLAAASVQLGRICTVKKVAQLEFSVFADEVSDKTLYPYYSRICRAQGQEAIAIARFIAARGWNNVGIVENVQFPCPPLFKSTLRDLGISTVQVTIPSSNERIDLGPYLVRFKTANVRAIFTTVQDETSFNLYRMSYKYGISGLHGVTWLTGTGVAGTFPFQNQFPEDGLCKQPPFCTEILRGMLFFVGQYGSPTDPRLARILDKFSQKDPAVYSARLIYPTVAVKAYCALAQDAGVMAFEAMTMMMRANATITGPAITQVFRTMQFSGLSGDVKLDANGDRAGVSIVVLELDNHYSHATGLQPPLGTQNYQIVYAGSMAAPDQPLYEIPLGPKMAFPPTAATGTRMYASLNTATGQIVFRNDVYALSHNCSLGCGGGYRNDSRPYLPNQNCGVYAAVTLTPVALSETMSNLTRAAFASTVRGALTTQAVLAAQQRMGDVYAPAIASQVASQFATSFRTVLTAEVSARLTLLLGAGDANATAACGASGQNATSLACVGYVGLQTAIGSNCSSVVASFAMGMCAADAAFLATCRPSPACVAYVGTPATAVDCGVAFPAAMSASSLGASACQARVGPSGALDPLVVACGGAVVNMTLPACASYVNATFPNTTAIGTACAPYLNASAAGACSMANATGGGACVPSAACVAAVAPFVPVVRECTFGGLAPQKNLATRVACRNLLMPELVRPSNPYAELITSCGIEGTKYASSACTRVGQRLQICRPIAPAHDFNNGECVSENTCACVENPRKPGNKAYIGADCSIPVCDPPCNQGRCVAPDTCACNPGWSGVLCDAAVCDPPYGSGACERDRGSCRHVDGASNACVCYNGYYGTRCELDCACTDHADPSTLGGRPVTVGNTTVTAMAFSCSAAGRCSCRSGYEGAKCEKKAARPLVIILPAVLCSTAVVLVACALLWLRLKRSRAEAELLNMDWCIDYKDVILDKQKGVPSSVSRNSLRSSHSNLLDSRASSHSKGDLDQIFILTGTYHGMRVAIKRIPKAKVQLTTVLRREMRLMRKTRHTNLVDFIGACVEPPNVCILTEYASRGSLADVLADTEVHLDWEFKYSIARDIAAGMAHLHNSPIGAHGRLTSMNCVIDSRWVTKVTDFGLASFRSHDDMEQLTEYRYYSGMFWTAPELIDKQPTPGHYSHGTKAGDIYSFGIIMFELLTREQPYADITAMMPTGIVLKVAMEGLRPNIPSEEELNDEPAPSAYIAFMKACWAENPLERPQSFEIVSEELLKQYPTPFSLVDNMIRLLERHAHNLRSVVRDRSRQLKREKERSEELLYRLMPKSVAQDLKLGRLVKPEYYENVTVMFSDIVGFSAVISRSSPFEIVDFLNSFYSVADAVIEGRDVYKVNTIGDIVIVVSGLPVRNENRHATEIADLALDFLAAVNGLTVPHDDACQLQLRIGIHSGPCVAGVVGVKMPNYSVFGDTINTASRMQTGGLALRIHLSNAAAQMLEATGQYHLEERGVSFVKGKGLMRTFFLTGKKGYGKQLPSLDMAVGLSKHDFK